MPEKILIIGPAWVGDMVMAQSLFKLLRQSRACMEIDVLAPAWSLPLLARMPEVSAGIIMPVGHGEFKLRERYRLAKKLRQKKYDQAIVLPNSFKSALIPWLASIKIRTGWLGEVRWGLLNDVRYLDKSRYQLMIERFMALGLARGEALPAVYPLPKLVTTRESQIAALKKHQLHPSQSVLVMSPGAEFGSAKRWPEAYYAEVANTLLQQGWSVWLLGSQKDAAVTSKIMELTKQRCIDLAGKTSLEEAVDLLSLARLVISNDSGLMHMAAALHRPLLAIYGPTSSRFTPPLQDNAKVISLSLPCQPCFQRTCPLKHHRCMQDLSPSQVLREMSELLN